MLSYPSALSTIFDERVKFFTKLDLIKYMENKFEKKEVIETLLCIIYEQDVKANKITNNHGAIALSSLKNDTSEYECSQMKLFFTSIITVFTYILYIVYLLSPLQLPILKLMRLHPMQMNPLRLQPQFNPII